MCAPCSSPSSFLGHHDCTFSQSLCCFAWYLNTDCPGPAAGYNADPDFTPSAALAIHHPGGNAKRISFANGTCGLPPILMFWPRARMSALR